MTTGFTAWLTRGGQSKVSFVLAIEGVREAFCSTRALSFRGGSAWATSERVTYEGLDPSSITTEESADWTVPQLKASGCTVTIADTKPDEAATRVFGGRVPTRRTVLVGTHTYSATTITVNSTAGWPASGYLYIGRETVRYTDTTANTFTGCTRGALGSVAHGHTSEVNGDVEVTNEPVAIERRRAQLYVHCDDETIGNVIWRGIVRNVRQTGDGLAWEVTLGHISELLEQNIGATVTEFPMRGYFFPTTAPLTLTVREFDGPDEGDNPARYNAVEVSGYYESLDALLSKINDELESSSTNWKDLTGAASAAVNDAYVVTVGGGGTFLQLTFRTDGASPRWAELFDNHFPAMPGIPGVGSQLYNEEGGRVRGTVAADDLMIIRSSIQGQLPSSFVDLRPRTYTEAPEDGSATPSDRIYYATDLPSTLTHIEVSGSSGRVTEAGGSSGRDVVLRLRVVSQQTSYLEVSADAPGMTVRTRLCGYPDAPVMIRPVFVIGNRRWDEMLRKLVDDSGATGPTGEQPWLPSAEFDWTSIVRESQAAGADDLKKDWRFRQSIKIEDVVVPELLACGLCWATTAAGTLTVRPVTVASAAAWTPTHIQSASKMSPSSQRTPTIASTPDGIVNDVLIRAGWNETTEKYESIEVGARMKASWQHYGRRRVVIEPRGTEISASLLADADKRARVARTIVNTFAYPYYVATFYGLSMRYAQVLLGDTIAVTDPRLCWRGVRGVTAARGQVVGRTVRWSAEDGGVDLAIRLSDWNAAAYAPSARIQSAGTGLTNSNLTVEYRGENAFSPIPDDASTFYDGWYFQVGDVCRIRQIDTTTASEQTGLTIVSVDRANKKVTFDTAVTADINATSKRFVLEYADWDSADGLGLAWTASLSRGSPAVPQRDYGFVADTTHTLGVGYDPAKLWGA